VSYWKKNQDCPQKGEQTDVNRKTGSGKTWGTKTKVGENLVQPLARERPGEGDLLEITQGDGGTFYVTQGKREKLTLKRHAGRREDPTTGPGCGRGGENSPNGPLGDARIFKKTGRLIKNQKKRAQKGKRGCHRLGPRGRGRGKLQRFVVLQTHRVEQRGRATDRRSFRKANACSVTEEGKRENPSIRTKPKKTTIDDQWNRNCGL